MLNRYAPKLNGLFRCSCGLKSPLGFLRNRPTDVGANTTSFVEVTVAEARKPAFLCAVHLLVLVNSLLCCNRTLMAEASDPSRHHTGPSSSSSQSKRALDCIYPEP